MCVRLCVCAARDSAHTRDPRPATLAQTRSSVSLCATIVRIIIRMIIRMIVAHSETRGKGHDNMLRTMFAQPWNRAIARGAHVRAAHVRRSGAISHPLRSCTGTEPYNCDNEGAISYGYLLCESPLVHARCASSLHVTRHGIGHICVT
eukprot:2937682-Rhodomonas_salina.1